MKAAQINKYGGAEVVEINQDAPKPQVSSGKILVAVRAAGVNPVDWKIREGYLSQMAPLKFPATLGGDFSGTVEEVGEGVDAKKGDAVFGQASILSGGSGAFSEFALADVRTAALKPKNVNHIEAAALPLSEAGAALEYLKTEHSRGKIVIEI